ncbi:hypothetical protein BAE44_0023515 [Dichanthelium oligosanthes]|uniref:WRC domain-containing protein n=1 Tax=Dichanthelium oligosanthes TaxID=888268 RepID=A0A1E5URG3_9POAL|nr:hypothetical protein BAE44_0023515 [Dichanthelium oligosanthes]
MMTGDERLSNGGVGAIVPVTTTMGANATKQGGSGGGGGTSKKPRGPGVLMEESRCSRKNGRGWRCSQPTLVGYAVCQYHVGKARMWSAAAAAARRSGAGQLGSTENGKRASAAAPAAASIAAPAPPKADVAAAERASQLGARMSAG